MRGEGFHLNTDVIEVACVPRAIGNRSSIRIIAELLETKSVLISGPRHEFIISIFNIPLLVEWAMSMSALVGTVNIGCISSDMSIEADELNAEVWTSIESDLSRTPRPFCMPRQH